MSKRAEAQIDEIVAMCDGDLRGALQALVLVNEHLELELEKYKSMTGSMTAIHLVGSLH